MDVADRKPIGPDHPVRHNRAAECYLCGKKLGRYDTKLIEQVEPYRIRCFFDDPFGCGPCNQMTQQDHDAWYLWSDG